MRQALLLVLVLVAAVAWAIDPPRAPPPAAPSVPAPSLPAPAVPAEPQPDSAAQPEAATEPAAAPAAEDETLPPLPPGAATRGPAPERFTPSEKVRADFPVSFPIDI